MAVFYWIVCSVLFCIVFVAGRACIRAGSACLGEKHCVVSIRFELVWFVVVCVVLCYAIFVCLGLHCCFGLFVALCFYFVLFCSSPLPCIWPRNDAPRGPGPTMMIATFNAVFQPRTAARPRVAAHAMWMTVL